MQPNKKLYFDKVPVVLFVTMESMKVHLEQANFDVLIGKYIHFLPPNLHDRFNDFTQQLLKSPETYVLLSLENWQFFSVGTKTPKPLEDLLKEIKNQIGVEKDTEKTDKLKQFGQRILWKWCEATFNYAFYAKIKVKGKYLM
jgi:hypothetical protein